MGTQRYILHPGVGQNPPLAGANRTQEDGTNFSFLEQDMPASQDTETHFQGIVVPPEKQAAGNITFRAIFRQVTTAVGNVRLDCSLASVALPGPRDIAPTSLVAATVAAPGTANQEFLNDWTKDITTVNAEDELVFKVKRIGTDGADTLGASEIALVRMEIHIPVVDAIAFDSIWSGNLLTLGNFKIWVDEDGPDYRLRVKDIITDGAIVGETDGFVIGEQGAA